MGIGEDEFRRRVKRIVDDLRSCQNTYTVGEASKAGNFRETIGEHGILSAVKGYSESDNRKGVTNGIRKDGSVIYTDNFRC